MMNYETILLLAAGTNVTTAVKEFHMDMHNVQQNRPAAQFGKLHLHNQGGIFVIACFARWPRQDQPERPR